MKIIKLIIICILINISFASAEKHNFDVWLQNFKTYSLKITTHSSNDISLADNND